VVRLPCNQWMGDRAILLPARGRRSRELRASSRRPRTRSTCPGPWTTPSRPASRRASPGLGPLRWRRASHWRARGRAI